MSTINLSESDPSINGVEHILSRRGFMAGLALVGISLTGCKPVEPVRTTGGSGNEGNNPPPSTSPFKGTTGGSGNEGNNPPPSETTNETGFVGNTSSLDVLTGGINEQGNTPPPSGFTGGSGNEGNNPPL